MALLAAPLGFAQLSGSFPGSEIDAATRYTQDRVEELFERGDYERAFFIYRNELTPIGDKYAQYMVGYMYLTGTGIDEDPIIGSAWYRLAAERGTPDFVTVRDQLLRSFDEPDRVRSDYYYLQLRRQYSDVVLLLNLVRDDFDSINVRTGSRLAIDSGTVSILDLGGTGGSRDLYRIRQSLKTRMRFLLQEVGRDDLLPEIDKISIKRLEGVIGEYVEQIDDR